MSLTAPPETTTTPSPPAVPPPLDWAQEAEARTLAAAVALTRAGRPWGALLARDAAKAAGLSPADAALLLPGGPRDLAALLWREHDEAGFASLAGRPRPERVSARIRAAALARVEAAMADEAAVRACSLYLARPGQAALAAKLGWGTADAIWRWAGDTSTDENHYSKRALLAGVLAATLTGWLAGGRAVGERQLDARLADVARIGQLTGRLAPLAPALAAAAAALGRLRYPGRA